MQCGLSGRPQPWWRGWYQWPENTPHRFCPCNSKKCYVANAHDEHRARETYDAHLRCESGRAYCEVGFYLLDRGLAARIDYGAVTGPVLVTGGTQDRIIGTDIPRQTAARYANGKYVEVDADHMQIFGPSLAEVLGHIDHWIEANDLTNESDRS